MQPEKKGFKNRQDADLPGAPGQCGCTTPSDSKSKGLNGEKCKPLPDSQAMLRELCALLPSKTGAVLHVYQV